MRSITNRVPSLISDSSFIVQAGSTGIKMLDNFADTLENHRAGILAYYDYPISTGPLEGTSNKIKTSQKHAYGFRNMEFFKLKIYALYEKSTL